jgi:site-specific recombinase XerD
VLPALVSSIPTIPNQPVSLTNAVNTWLTRYVSSNTNRTYADCLLRIAKIVPLQDLIDIDLDGAQKIVSALAERYSAYTVDTTCRAMSSLWRELARQGIVDGNPWRHVKIPKPKDTLKERILTEAEVARLLEAAESQRDKAFVRFMYGTGLRITEAVSVTWEDITWDDEGRAWMTVYGKGGKTRTVEIPGTVVGDLVRLWRGREKKGRLWPFCKRTGQRIVERLRAVVGKPVSAHWMRHARITHALRHGAPLYLVQATAGHSSPTTTMRYTHVLPGDSDLDFLPGI